MNTLSKDARKKIDHETKVMNAAINDMIETYIIDVVKIIFEDLRNK